MVVHQEATRPELSAMPMVNQSELEIFLGAFCRLRLLLLVVMLRIVVQAQLQQIVG